MMLAPALPNPHPRRLPVRQRKQPDWFAAANKNNEQLDDTKSIVIPMNPPFCPIHPPPYWIQTTNTTIPPSPIEAVNAAKTVVVASPLASQTKRALQHKNHFSSAHINKHPQKGPAEMTASPSSEPQLYDVASSHSPCLTVARWRVTCLEVLFGKWWLLLCYYVIRQGTKSMSHVREQTTTSSPIHLSNFSPGRRQSLAVWLEELPSPGPQSSQTAPG
jgi:hypothetical protein